MITIMATKLNGPSIQLHRDLFSIKLRKQRSILSFIGGAKVPPTQQRGNTKQRAIMLQRACHRLRRSLGRFDGDSRITKLAIPKTECDIAPTKMKIGLRSASERESIQKHEVRNPRNQHHQRRQRKAPIARGHQDSTLPPDAELNPK